MKIKDSVKYYLLGKSIKQIQMDKILDKISKKGKLTDKEKRFLDLYNQTSNDTFKDFMMISKNTAYKKVKLLINSGKVVVCNITDRDGKIGLPIKNIVNKFDENFCEMIVSDDTSHKLFDRYLYNLIYKPKKDRYSLEEHDEYYEKIESKF